MKHILVVKVVYKQGMDITLNKYLPPSLEGYKNKLSFIHVICKMFP